MHDKSLVTSEIANNHGLIIDNHNKTCDDYDNDAISSMITRNFDSGISLTFITPWHRKGYKWTERFTNKFTHISPTWYKITKFPNSDKVLIMGDNDVDKHWIQKIRAKSGILYNDYNTIVFV